MTIDLWETLIFERDGYDARRALIRCTKLAEVLNSFGIHVPTQKLLSALKTMSSWLADIWARNDEVTNIDQIRFIIDTATCDSVNLKDEWLEKLSLAYASAIFELPPYLNPDVPNLLRWLKHRNKKIGLISNVGRTPGFSLLKFLQEKGVDEYFDVMIFSDEVGIRKPNPEIFHLTARRLDVEPGRCVHIGDNLMSDVWGAMNAGFRAIHLSTENGRDMLAESDPTSLISASRSFSGLKEEEIIPDKIITSLALAIEAIEDIER